MEEWRAQLEDSFRRSGSSPEAVAWKDECVNAIKLLKFAEPHGISGFMKVYELPDMSLNFGEYHIMWDDEGSSPQHWKEPLFDGEPASPSIGDLVLCHTPTSRRLAGWNAPPAESDSG
ncbi:MAG: hypothetical protein JWM59_3226 [Verrucomicrobiales bacterium]|nr:hypothetical protein [Verrucomicrobiales bacterium]